MEQQSDAGATSGTDQPTISWTMFRTPAAMSLEVKQHTLAELAQFLADAGPFKNKASCPWIKLAQFGNKRSRSNSLRNNANVVSISGVEGDYDGEQVTPEQAVEALERHGIRAIVYTSPSYTADKPRWRVIAPCAAMHTPDARNAILARINGALGGILSAESFTLSQSYYFGEVEGVEYKVFVTFNDPEEGACVDELDELDEIAVRKEARRHIGDDEENGVDYSIRMFEDLVARKGRRLKTGDGRRELIKQYVASRSGKGLLRDELLAMVEGVVNRYFDPADPIEAQNVLDVIDYFVAKDAGQTVQPVDLSGFTLAAAPPQQPPAVVERRREKGLVEYPAPFPGVMADICAAAAKAAYKPQPRLNMMAALIGMAGGISGEYSTRAGGRFNLFGLGALESGGGKDMPRQMAEIVAAAAKGGILGKPASGAGLEDSISDRRAFLVSVDEVAHLLAAVNDDRAPAHLKDIAAALLKLYSASRSSYNRRVLATGSTTHKLPTMVANPCLSMIGFATPEGLGEALDERNLKDGLLGRMLYVPGDSGVVPRRPEGGLDVPESVTAWASQLTPPNALAQSQPIAAIGSVVVQEGPGIGATMDRLLADMERSRGTAGDTLSPALYARSFEKLERIAGILAIAEDPQAPVIRAPHVEWARAFVLASDDHLLAFAGHHMHTGEATRVAAQVRETIRLILAHHYRYQRPVEKEAVENGCVSRSQLLRVSKLEKAVLDKALAQLADLEELQAFDQRGKPTKFITDIQLS